MERDAWARYTLTKNTGTALGKPSSQRVSQRQTDIDTDIRNAKDTHAHTNIIKDFLILAQPSLKADFLALNFCPDDVPLEG